MPKRCGIDLSPDVVPVREGVDFFDRLTLTFQMKFCITLCFLFLFSYSASLTMPLTPDPFPLKTATNARQVFGAFVMLPKKRFFHAIPSIIYYFSLAFLCFKIYVTLNQDRDA